MTDITKIPKYILDEARKNTPLIWDREFTDEELSKKSKREIFEHYLQWQGIIGYGNRLVEAIEGIFNIELKEDE